ncbi:MAG: hypothetical protein ACRDRV_04300 [Pseudonocardiaceae bacterium]
MVRPAEVRFYFDADLLGLAKVVVQLRPDVTYPGDPADVVHKRKRPPCPISSPAEKDRIWIPKVAGCGWLIITRDSAIQRYRAELAAVRESDARMVALAGRDATSTWAQLELFMTQWRAIEALTRRNGPFIYTATRTAPLRAVDLD